MNRRKKDSNPASVLAGFARQTLKSLALGKERKGRTEEELCRWEAGSGEESVTERTMFSRIRPPIMNLDHATHELRQTQISKCDKSV